MQNLAEKWVQRCHWGHPSHQDPIYSGTGQNIAALFGQKPTYVGLAKLWYDEVVNYTYADNSCKKVCGHYTQVSLSVCLSICNVYTVTMIIYK